MCSYCKGCLAEPLREKVLSQFDMIGSKYVFILQTCFTGTIKIFEISGNIPIVESKDEFMLQTQLTEINAIVVS